MAIITTDTTILLVLLRAAVPLTQSEIADVCKAMTGEQVKPLSSSLSDQMERLGADGLVRCTLPKGGHVYRPYELTDEGRVKASARAAALTALVSGPFPPGWKSRHQVHREETEAVLARRAPDRAPPSLDAIRRRLTGRSKA